MPKPAPLAELELFPSDAEPTRISGKAIASLALGLVFVFACFSGVPAVILGGEALRDIRLSGGWLRGKGMATAGIVLGVIGCLLTLAFFLPERGHQPSRRAHCVNNLKQIGLAMDEYHDVYGRLPPAATVDKHGKPLLSWRVAILPLLEFSDLHAKFHLDEPWDSPHNLALIDQMPPIYACLSDSALKPGMTGYQAVLGPNTAFTPDFTPVRFPDITDGLSTTLLVGESRRAVPWTKPEDLPLNTSLPRNGLGSAHKDGFNAAFADGSVRFLKASISPGILGALLTRNGNELVPADF